MKQCTSCYEVKELDSFSFQKRNPKKLYAYCDSCMNAVREQRVETVKPIAYRNEIYAMRNKARQLRAFNPEQVKQIREMHAQGITQKAIAKEFGRSPSAVSKAIRGYK